jgi:tetratricopeptide (TPR) repeat protein
MKVGAALLLLLALTGCRAAKPRPQLLPLDTSPNLEAPPPPIARPAEIASGQSELAPPPAGEPAAPSEPTPSPPASKDPLPAPAQAQAPAAAEPAPPAEHPELPSAVDARPKTEGTDAAGLQEATKLAAKQAIDAQDYVRARGLIEQLLSGPYLREARTLLADHRPDEARTIASHALSLAPDQPELLLVQGEASLAVGLERGDRQLLEDALRAFERLLPRPEGYFGASRSALALQRADDALRFAREGLRLLDQAPASQGLRANLPEPPERTLAAACAAAYFAAHAANPADSREAFAQAHAALSRWIAAHPDDPWGWERIASVHFEQGNLQDALEAAERGLDRNPRDEDVARLVARVARARSGSKGALEAFARFRSKHPTAALGEWYPAVELFESALEQLERHPLYDLQTAERGFRNCRQLEPRYSDSCLDREILCRCATGWARFHAGDFDRARAAFESMEALAAGGMRRGLEPKLRSGVEGLLEVAEGWRRKSELTRAAGVCDALHAYDPSQVAWAVGAGASNRDAATREEDTAVQLERAARGEIQDRSRLESLRKLAKVKTREVGTDKETERYRDASLARHALAQELFERSYQAYLDGVALAPEDLRILNDAAVIAIHYLRRDAAHAEELLRRAVDIGERQLAEPSLGETARLELLNAWGDVHQNLGVLHLELKHDPSAARGWFEKSLAIGPAPRPVIVERFLPRCPPPSGGTAARSGN